MFIDLLTRLHASYVKTLEDNLSHYKMLTVAIHPVSLFYSSASYEHAFNQYYNDWICERVRTVSLLVIITALFDILLSILGNRPFKPSATIDIVTILANIILISNTYTTFFKRHHQVYLSVLIILYNIFTLSVNLSLSDDEYQVHSGYIYFPALICCLLGLKYLNSLIIMLSVVIMFNVILTLFGEAKADHLFRYNSIFFIYIFIGVSVNYLLEFSMRREFIYQQALESDRKKYVKLAQTDSLTKINNRFGLINKLNKQVDLYTKSSASGSLGVLIFIDLNDFKAINDTHGHLVGDKVLKIVAQRLKESYSGNNNIIARLGGDEFIVFLNFASKNNDIDYWHKHIQQQLSAPIQLARRFPVNQLSISASTGHSILYANDTSIVAMIEQADQAMYQHKRKIKKDRENNG